MTMSRAEYKRKWRAKRKRERMMAKQEAEQAAANKLALKPLIYETERKTRFADDYLEDLRGIAWRYEQNPGAIWQRELGRVREEMALTEGMETANTAVGEIFRAAYIEATNQGLAAARDVLLNTFWAARRNQRELTPGTVEFIRVQAQRDTYKAAVHDIMTILGENTEYFDTTEDYRRARAV